MLRRVVLGVLAMLLLLSNVGCEAVVTDGGTTPAGEATSTAKSGAPQAAKLLTPADVEKVSGLTGLKVVPYDPAQGAGGDVNIATASNQLVAMLVVANQETWDEWLTDGFTISESVTPPVGDESFIGPNPDTSPVIYTFGFRKGNVAIVIDTFIDANGEAILSVEQLRALAETVAGRL